MSNADFSVCNGLPKPDREAVAWFDDLRKKGATTVAGFHEKMLQDLYDRKDGTSVRLDVALLKAKLARLHLDKLQYEFKDTRSLHSVAQRVFFLQQNGDIHPFHWSNDSDFTDHVHNVDDLLYCRKMSCYEFVHWCGWMVGPQRISVLTGAARIHSHCSYVMNPPGPISSANAKAANYSVKDGLIEERHGHTFTYRPQAGKVILGTVPYVPLITSGMNNDADYNHVGISDGRGGMTHLNFGRLKSQLIGEVFTAQRGWGNVYEADYNHLV